MNDKKLDVKKTDEHEKEGLEIARRLAQVLPRHPDYRDLPAWFEERLRELEVT